MTEHSKRLDRLPLTLRVMRELGEQMHPLWREDIADRIGVAVPIASACIDELAEAGLVRRVQPRKNDEWFLTQAGCYAFALLKEAGGEYGVASDEGRRDG